MADRILIATLVAGAGEVRVALDEYRGTRTIDVRVFEPFTAAKVPMPTTKGLTLSVTQLPQLVRALAKAEAKARELGLIGGAE